MTETTAPNKLVFNVPSRQAPGFVRRQSRLLRLMKMMKSAKALGDDLSIDEIERVATMWDEVIDFLADFIQAPSREDAMKLLQEASEEQFDEMFGALAGSSPKVQEGKTPSKPKSANSGKRSKGTNQQ